MATADKQIAQLLGSIAAELPGCATAEKIAALEQAAVRFCRQSRAWRHTLTVDIPAGERAVALAWPLGAISYSTDLYRVDGLLVVRGCVTYAFRVVSRQTGTWRQGIEFEAALSADRAIPIEVHGVLAPVGGPVAGSDSIHMPEWIIDRYSEAIAAGAVAKLKRHAGKPYSDPDGATYADREFLRGVADACFEGAQSVGRVVL